MAFQLNMTKGVSIISNEVHNLHMTIFWVCVGIGVIVFGVMLYAILYHRKSLGREAAKFHDNTTVEIIWSIIPFIILVLMAIPATKLLLKMSDSSDSDLTIKVTGIQWRWGYEYLGEGVSFISNLITSQEQIQNRDIKSKDYLLEVDNHLVIPVGKKVRFLTTSNDVIHSWWVPDLGFKRDAIPGFINESWTRVEKPGVFRGQCAELCGVNHGFMPIVVEAVPEDIFLAWLAEKKGGPKVPGNIGTKDTITGKEQSPEPLAKPQESETQESETSSTNKEPTSSTNKEPTSEQP